VRVLAVDTTTARGSLAIVDDDEVRVEVRRETADGHSTWLLPTVEEVLHGLSLSAFDLDGFAVAVGPGSFTGLRVGLATVQGLALATGRLVAGLSSLDVLASSARDEGATVVALMDAFRGEVFAAAYERGRGLRGTRVVGTLDGVLHSLIDGAPEPLAFVGDAARREREALRGRAPGARFPEVPLFLASELGRQGALVLRRGDGVAPRALRPLYLRGADIRASRR